MLWETNEIVSKSDVILREPAVNTGRKSEDSVRVDEFGTTAK